MESKPYIDEADAEDWLLDKINAMLESLLPPEHPPSSFFDSQSEEDAYYVQVARSRR
jgi:hypothetical protein